MRHVIRIQNPVTTSIPTALATLVAPCVSYEAVFWKPSFRGKERKTYSKSMITKAAKGTSYLWSGLVPRVVDYCKENNIDVEVIDESQEDIDVFEPELPGITFRPDQLNLINAFLDNPRGIIEAATGMGKTVVAFGIISSFPKAKVLFMVHKKDLMLQAKDEAIRFGFKSIGLVGDGHAEYDKQITIATRQSFVNIADQYGHLYDMIIQDEVHNSGAEYEYLLARVPAPIRLGLTATMPKEGQVYLTAVGLIGPIVGTLTINEGAELGILSKPHIKFVKLPECYELSQVRNYAEVYAAAIVNRLVRNQKIAEIAKEHSDKGNSVLIMINHLAQGHNIVEQLDLLGVKSVFIQGSTESDVRTETKHALNTKEILVVICSQVWVEGVNLPELNCVIYAAGGKSEIRTMQSIGRGLRKTKDKSQLWFYDFLDLDSKYLISHLGSRLSVYSDSDWL